MPAEVKAYVFYSIALTVEFTGLVQFIGWVVPSHVYIDIVLNRIISKLQYSVFYVKRAINRVPAFVISSILG